MSQFYGSIASFDVDGHIIMGDCGLQNQFVYLPTGKAFTIGKHPVEPETSVIKEWPQYTIEQYSVPVEDLFLNLRLLHLDHKKGKHICFYDHQGITGKIVGPNKNDKQNLVFCGSVSYFNQSFTYGLMKSDYRRKKATEQEVYDAVRAEYFGKYIIFTYVQNQDVPKAMFARAGFDIVHETKPCTNRLHTERNDDASVLYLVKVS